MYIYLFCSSKCKVYMHVIDHFTLQYYLTKAIPIKYIEYLCHHIIKLLSTNTPINNHNCKLCHSDIEDEFHFVLKRPHFHDIRCKYIKKYYWKIVFKYIQLLSA